MNISKYKPVIMPNTFCASIGKALQSPFDVDSSMKRIRNTLNSLPAGKLYISKQKHKVTFYSMIDGKQSYLSKQSNLIHPLARKRYLELLLEILQLTTSTKVSDMKRRRLLIYKLEDLIYVYSKGNLDLAQIVLTSKQYRWYTRDFWQKFIDPSKSLETASGVLVRSKSERDIINAAESMAVPLHYEEQTIIFVRPLVEKLRDDLIRRFKSGEQPGFSKGQLYAFKNENIHWNVPAELEWMNVHGSIWKSYYPADGTVAIYNDFVIMLANGELFIWEHSGLMDHFIYRCNSSERVAVMKYTGVTSRNNFLETYEHDIDTPEKLINIIERTILPRLWF